MIKVKGKGKDVPVL